MDGTIIDSEQYWMAAETALVESWGGTWTHDDGLSLVGSGMWHTARVMQSRGVDLAEQPIIDILTESVRGNIAREVPWRPGARELLLALSEAGMPQALVTMSERPLAELVSRAIDFAPFSAIVSSNDVTHAKPHPEPYLLGAQQLGIAIAECVAIEDSEPGVASAVASGAVTIGVPHTVSLLDVEAHTIWETLVGRSPADIAEVFSKGRAS